MSKQPTNDFIVSNSIFGWLAFVTVLLLSIPLIAMQFRSDVVWTLSDFVIAGLLLFGFGSAFVLVARKTNKKYRSVIGLGFIVALLYVWAELSVGVFTNIGS